MQGKDSPCEKAQGPFKFLFCFCGILQDTGLLADLQDSPTAKTKKTKKEEKKEKKKEKKEKQAISTSAPTLYLLQTGAV